MPLGAVIKLYGGWRSKEAICGAKRLAATCCRLGKPWVMIDEMSGLTMYLVLRRQFKHILKQKWEIYEEHSMVTNDDGSGAGGAGGAVAATAAA